MTSQVVFNAKSIELKKRFASRSKQEGIPMSVLLNAFMESYVEGKYEFGILERRSFDFQELEKNEISQALAERIERSKAKPLSSFQNI